MKLQTKTNASLEIAALTSGNVEVFRAARQTAEQKGKTKLNTVKKSKGADRTEASEKELARAREMIVTIAQNIDIIKFYSGSKILLHWLVDAVLFWLYNIHILKNRDC
jgi:hypothetical protein